MQYGDALEVCRVQARLSDVCLVFGGSDRSADGETLVDVELDEEGTSQHLGEPNGPYRQPRTDASGYPINPNLNERSLAGVDIGVMPRSLDGGNGK